MNRGFTLVEAVVSLALFMLLTVGVLLLWQHAARSAAYSLGMQNTLDNLGAAMDGIVRNIEFSHTIVLYTNSDDVLLRLELTGVNPSFQPHTYVFTFNPNALPTQAMYKSLFFGGQQYAYGIEEIRIVNAGYARLDITIVSVCASRVALRSSANVQHKHVKLR